MGPVRANPPQQSPHTVQCISEDRVAVLVGQGGRNSPLYAATVHPRDVDEGNTPVYFPAIHNEESSGTFDSAGADC